jgi:hypothetical protein
VKIPSASPTYAVSKIVDLLAVTVISIEKVCKTNSGRFVLSLQLQEIQVVTRCMHEETDYDSELGVIFQAWGDAFRFVTHVVHVIIITP